MDKKTINPVRLVVDVLEANNFHFLDKELSMLIQGKLEGVPLSTDPVPLSSMEGQRLKFGNELVWKLSSRNFNRIKASKALKLECLTFAPGSSKADSIGYIIVNLKTVTDCSTKSLGWRKVLGCASVDSKNSPQVLMAVALLDDTGNREREKKLSLDKKVEEINGRPTEVKERGGASYIGPEKFCKERFQMTCMLHSASHIGLLIPDKKSVGEKQCHLEINLLDQKLKTQPFEPTNKPKSFEKHFVWDVMSREATLRQFLSEQPPIEVMLCRGKSVVCHTKQFLDLSLNDPLNITMYLDSRDLDGNVQPSVNLTLSIASMDNATKMLERLKEATVVTPSAPPLSDEDTDNELVSEFSKFDMNSQGPQLEERGVSPIQIDERVPVLERLQPTSAKLSFEHHVEHQVKQRQSEEERMTLVVEELEDWKLQQKILFAAELKEEKQRLHSEWEKKMKERQMMLEFDKMRSLEKTAQLSVKLESEIQKLALKEEDLKKVEEKFKQATKTLEAKVLEQKKAMAAQKEDAEERISVLVYQSKQQQQRVDLLEAECIKLKKINASNESAEVLELKEKLRVMEEKLRKAETERTKMTLEQAKTLQRARNAIELAKEQTSLNSSANINQLKRDKDSLEKLRASILSRNERVPRVLDSDSAQVLKLQEQRAALLKTGSYNEQSDAVKHLDKAIRKVQMGHCSGDED